MQLSAIVTDIQDEANKGSMLTADRVKAKVRDALRTLESMNNWAYMDRYVTFTLDKSATEPRALPMPVRVKNIEFIRLSPGNGQDFRYLTECSPRDITSIDVALPSHYFKDAMQYLWLDNTPDQNYAGEMSYRQYTEWTGADTMQPWPFANMYPLVKYQTLVLLAPFLREPTLLQMYKELLGQQLKIFVDMNEELEWSNTSNQMEYK